MSRRLFNDGMELVYGDLNAIPAAIERGIYERVIYELVMRTENAFFQDGFKPTFLGATSVTVNAGLGMQTDSSQVSPESKRRPLVLSASATVNLQAADSSNPRIDLICVKNGLGTELSATRNYKDPVSSAITSQTFVIQQDDQASVIAVTGTAAASPVAPAVPTGYIAIAQCYVTAVVGMVSSAAVTDLRTLMPLAGGITLNTAGFLRLTAGSAVTLSSLFSGIDTLLYRGAFNYYDLDALASDPSAPAASKYRVYIKSGVAYMQDSSGVKTPLGSGSGGGAGASWQPEAGAAPLSVEEYGQAVFSFDQADPGALALWVKVPSGYLSGRQIRAKVSGYSPSTSNSFLFKTTTTLIRQGNDAVSSTANQYISTNVALVNTVANQLREIVLDLTTTSGGINSLSVSPGDMLKIELGRGTDTDIGSVRIIPSATEILFG